MHNSSRAGHFTQCDYLGICYIFQNEVFCKHNCWQNIFAVRWNGFTGPIWTAGRSLENSFLSNAKCLDKMLSFRKVPFELLCVLSHNFSLSHNLSSNGSLKPTGWLNHVIIVIIMHNLHLCLYHGAKKFFLKLRNFKRTHFAFHCDFNRQIFIET